MNTAVEFASRSQRLPRVNFARGARMCVAGLAVIAALGGCSVPPQHEDKASASGASSVAAEPKVAAPRSHLRLISSKQYFQSIGSLFGPDVLPNFSFAPFERTDGLVIAGAASVEVNETQVELYQRAATHIAGMVVAPERRDFLIPCKPKDPTAADKTCATKFLSYVGPRLFRHPLPPQRLEKLVAESGSYATQLGDFYTGLSMVLEGLLTSPNTLYIEEIAEPDPNNPGEERLNAYSLASRLSFFLWNMAPDDALLAAAAKGDLHRPEGRARVVDRMLASANLEAGVRAFFDDMLALEAFEVLSKDPQVYPAFTAVVARDAREQILRMLVDQLITKNGDYRDVFISRDTFVSTAMAPIYQISSPKNWIPYTAPMDSPRAGLLAQVGFLASHSHPGRSSPTLRGKALRELLLCQTVPPPPANVDFSALENPPAHLKTTRARVDFHLQNPACAGCHRLTDPIGLAFEGFDGAGKYRDTENGTAIDSSGTLDGKAFKNAVGLGEVLREHPALPACLVKRLYSYGIGRPVTRGERPLINYFNEGFAADKYRLPALMRKIALSEGFARVDDHSAPAAQ